MKNLFLITILFLSNFLFSQIQFDKSDSDYKIISQLFDAKMIEKDTSFYWFPNSIESVQFDSSMSDTLFTKIDTIFKHDLKKILKVLVQPPGSFRDEIELHKYSQN